MLVFDQHSKKRSCVARNGLGPLSRYFGSWTLKDFYDSWPRLAGLFSTSPGQTRDCHDRNLSSYLTHTHPTIPHWVSRHTYTPGTDLHVHCLYPAQLHYSCSYINLFLVFFDYLASFSCGLLDFTCFDHSSDDPTGLDFSTGYELYMSALWTLTILNVLIRHFVYLSFLNQSSLCLSIGFNMCLVSFFMNESLHCYFYNCL